MFVSHYDSPLGKLTLASDGIALTGLWFDGQAHFGSTISAAAEERDLPVFVLTRHWLDAYFQGRPLPEPPPLRPIGTPYQLTVWSLLAQIPYGQTVTYGKLAASFPGKTSARAIGGAVGRNPISILIPCHRVVGAGGNITGYAGGIDRKKHLLQMETQSLR